MKRFFAIAIVGLIGFLAGSLTSLPSLMAKDIQSTVASSPAASPQLVDLRSPFASSMPSVGTIRVGEPFFTDGPHWVTLTNPSTGRVQQIDGVMYVDAGPIPGCPGAQAQNLEIGEYRIPGPAILNGWTNLSGQDQSMWKTVIHTGEVFTLAPMGGTLWWFADSCSSDELIANYNSNPLPAQSWQQLHDRGIAR